MPKVFIAYSHDSIEHVDRVRRLADTLRLDGVDADIDQYHLSPPEGWSAWVSQQIDIVDFVILVCTGVFNRRFCGEDKASIGLGVQWEGAVLQDTIFRDGDTFEVHKKHTKFVPVVFLDGDVTHIPIPFRALTFYNLGREDGYESLYRLLTDQPRVLLPQIGNLAPLPAKADVDLIKGLKVFLCHSSKDKSTVRELHKRLLSCGVRPWLDEEDLLAGQLWRVEIPKAIRSSDAVVVCLSPNAVTRAGYFQKEVKFALDVLDEQPEGAIFLVPLKLAECNIPERLGHIHCVSMFEAEGFNKLVLSLQARAQQISIEARTDDVGGVAPTRRIDTQEDRLTRARYHIETRLRKRVAVHGMPKKTF